MDNKTITKNNQVKTNEEIEDYFYENRIRFTNEQLELLASAYIFCYKNIGMCEFEKILAHDFKTKYNKSFSYKISLTLYTLNSVIKKLYPIEHLRGYKRIFKIYKDIINDSTKLESSRLKLKNFIDTFSIDPSAYYDIFSLDESNIMSVEEYDKKHNIKSLLNNLEK